MPNHKSISDMTEQELFAIQKNGVDADNFAHGDNFYTAVVRPGVDYEREIAKKDSDWTPGKSMDPVEIALVNAYNSGKRAGLAIVDVVCQRISVRGKDASQELARRAKKKENR